jgi:hypothetical protein
MLYKRATLNKLTADREMAESNFYEPKYFSCMNIEQYQKLIHIVDDTTKTTTTQTIRWRPSKMRHIPKTTSDGSSQNLFEGTKQDNQWASFRLKFCATQEGLRAQSLWKCLHIEK